MKYCIIIPDGICDFPHMRTKNLTPLDIARMPGLNFMVSHGRFGMVETIPRELPAESLVSTMSILGFDPLVYYTGRAGFEAIAMGIPVGTDDWVFSCDLVSTFDGILEDVRAGQIRTLESRILTDDLNRHFADYPAHFYLCDSYHLLIVLPKFQFCNVQTREPMSFVGKPLEQNYPDGEGSKILIDIMKQAHELLDNHEINKVRRELRENPADNIWLWGGGIMPALPSFEKTFHLRGGFVTAYPEMKGLARNMGLEIIEVPGATGSWDTDYQAKADYTLRALQSLDIVFLHIGAPMVVSRYGEISQKVRVLEQIDAKIIKYLQEAVEKDTRIMIVGGCFISVQDRVGRREPVPFVIWGDEIPCATREISFNERNARKANFNIAPGYKLLNFLLSL